MSLFINGVYAATREDMWSFDALCERRSEARKRKEKIEHDICLIGMSRGEKERFWAVVGEVNYRLDRLLEVRRRTVVRFRSLPSS